MNTLTIKKGDLYTILLPERPEHIRIAGVAITDSNGSGYFEGLETTVSLRDGEFRTFSATTRCCIGQSRSGQVVYPLVPRPELPDPVARVAGTITELTDIVDRASEEGRL